MPFTIILHIQNEEPVVGEVDELPEKDQWLIVLTNPRRLDGKELPYLAENVGTVMWPLTRITYIEVLPSKEEEEIFGFVRE